MLILIPFIGSAIFNLNSQGIYSLKPNKDDILNFSLGKEDRAYIFSSLDQRQCLTFPETISDETIPTSLYGLSFDLANFEMVVNEQVNISIWIINKNYCHPNSLYVMASYNFTLEIKPQIDPNETFYENSMNYCIFSPSHLIEYRTVSFAQTNFVKCSIYSSNIFAPDYQTEGKYIESILSSSYFLKISIPADGYYLDYQTLKMSFVDEKTVDYSFVSSSGFYSNSYYYSDGIFSKKTGWINDIRFTPGDKHIKWFSWVLIVAAIIFLIIVMLLCIFIIYFVIKKKNVGDSQLEDNEDENDIQEECAPDAQRLEQVVEANEESNNQTEKTAKIKKKKIKKNEKEKKDKFDNPYCVSEDSVYSDDSSESFNPNVVEINPYSLPKA